MTKTLHGASLSGEDLGTPLGGRAPESTPQTLHLHLLTGEAASSTPSANHPGRPLTPGVGTHPGYVPHPCI